MARHEPKTGPRGGVTTIAPSGWQKTTVYLRKDQIRALKLSALDSGATMSHLLRRAIDVFLDWREKEPHLIEHVLSDQDDLHIDEADDGG